MIVSFRQAEHSLYNFPVNLMRWQDRILDLHRLRQETDCHAQNYEANHSSEGTHSEPVANYYVLIETAENAINGLGRKVIPVLRLRNFLKIAQSERYRTMYYVMELYYFERWKMDAVAEHLQKSVKTVSRRRHELVDLTREELERGVFDYELEHNNGNYPAASGSGSNNSDVHPDESERSAVSGQGAFQHGV